ncbi:MAG: hypothetical protein IJI14_12005 [Anaerolineaceae bacterium]|nr:hypothetical protein [Anaerolineaceae bacterium]
MNTSVQTEELYKPSGYFQLIPFSRYNFAQRNKPKTKEIMPSYTGNLIDYLKAGNKEQQEQISQLWRFLAAYFPNPELNNLDHFPMHTYVMDDGCISVEWHFRNMNIAFDIETDPDESGWSLCSTREAGLYSIGGYLCDAASVEKAVKQIYDVLHQQWGSVSYAER